MSYDITFVIPGTADDPVEPWRNYTSNVSGMWSEAIGIERLADLIRDNPKPADLLPYIERGIEAMKAHPDKYRAMNPSNGWGDYDGALAYLEWLAQGCRDYPGAEVSVWA